MLIIFKDNPTLGEIAYAKYQERKRIAKIAYTLSKQLPEKYQDTRKKNLIAKDVSDRFYYELIKMLENI